jgi:quercetin dioxygenase-like cupin family protein
MLMLIVRRADRPALDRGPGLPTLQQLVDRANGSNAVTVLVNHFTDAETVPLHVHDVEEVLLVVAGQCTVTVSGREEIVAAGDAVIVEPGLDHSITHQTPQPCTVIAVLGSPDLQIGPTSIPAM